MVATGFGNGNRMAGRGQQSGRMDATKAELWSNRLYNAVVGNIVGKATIRMEANGGLYNRRQQSEWQAAVGGLLFRIR